MEAACPQEPSLTSVSTALHPSEAPITYADMCSFTQVLCCAYFHHDVIRHICSFMVSSLFYVISSDSSLCMSFSISAFLGVIFKGSRSYPRF